MFCTECGTKLDDGATLCTNCGHQIPASAAAPTMDATPVAEPVAAPVAESVVAHVATPVAEPVATPVVEPAPAVSQPMYSQPVAQPMYSQPANQSMYSEPVAQNGAMYGATQPQNTYGNTQQNVYGSTQPQNAYGNAQNASYNYAAAPQEPQKKKGKGCLIAALITGGVCLLGVIIIIIAIVLGLKGCADAVEGESIEASYSDEYSDADWYTETSDFTVPSELDSEMESVSESESEEIESTVVSDGTYTIEDITGAWTGTTSLVSIMGASEMQSYLEGLYGRSLTQSEIDGLTNAPATDDYAELYVYDYEGDDGKIYPGSWELDLDMGDFFGDQVWDDWDALTYDEFTYGDRSLGCITLDENNSFYIEVMEVDYLGEYGSQFFDAYDYDVQDYEVEEDGAYGIVFSGQVSEGAYGPQIIGEFIVMFQYGDMAEPYGMAYEYTMDYLYEY